MNLDRRTLLVGGGVGVGLIVAWALWPRGLDSALPATGEGARFGNFIRIDRDGRVTVAIPQVETGQGAWTALPQIAADELGAAWEQVAVEPAPLVADYANPLAEVQGWAGVLPDADEAALRITAGATSVRAFDDPLRRATALARTMLVGAAADRWNVDPTECDCADGFVFHRGQSFAFGDLAEEAATRSPPSDPQPRRGDKGRLAGKPLQRLDTLAKANGSWRFAGDVRLPDLLFASVRLAPAGGRLDSFDRSALSGQAGVRHLAVRDGWIAVVADSWWHAERALHAAAPRFTAPETNRSPRQVFDRALADATFTSLGERGDVDSALGGMRPIAATYYVAPSQHLALEPRSATARLERGVPSLWAGTQAPGLASAAAGDGSFYPMPVGDPAGRSIDDPLSAIALELTRATGRPVQVTLPPSVAQAHDAVSPGALVQLTALNGDGGITAALRLNIVTSDGMAASLARGAGADAPDTLGKDFAEAAPPYGIPNLSVRGAAAVLPWHVGYMRGSPEREMVFATECFMDELAQVGGLGPLNLRMALLGQNFRLARCLQAATRRANWDGGDAGSNMGLAAASAFGSQIALVAEASIGEAQSIEVARLTCAVDCGRVINPALVRQQVEGALIWALGQATAAAPDWHGALPRARTMTAIGLPTIRRLPAIDIVIVPSGEAPGGVNGLGALPLAPAVGNAIFAATGKRMRSLPFDPMAAA